MPLPNVSAQSEEQISWVDDVDIYPLQSISDTPEVLEAFRSGPDWVPETGQPSYAESAADDKLRFVVAARPTTSLAAVETAWGGRRGRGGSREGRGRWVASDGCRDLSGESR